MGRQCARFSGWMLALIGSAAVFVGPASIARAQPATTGLIATDAGHDRIVEFTLWPNPLSVLWEGAPLNQPTGMIRYWSATYGNELLVCNAGDGSIVAINEQTQTHRTILPPGHNPMVSPADIMEHSKVRGVLYMLDKHDGAVHRFDVETGTFIDIVVAPLAPASSMTLMSTPNPEFKPVVIIAYPTLGKVNRYDAITGALMNTVAEVESPAWVDRDYYAHVGVLEDVADPAAPDKVRWYTQEGTAYGTVMIISSGTAPNDLHHSQYASGLFLLFDDRLENLWNGATIPARPGSRFDNLMVYEHCYANCDPGGEPINLDVFDFLCFQDSWVKGEPYACDCDTSTGNGVCDIFDFLCYQNAFVMGCP